MLNRFRTAFAIAIMVALSGHVASAEVLAAYDIETTFPVVAYTVGTNVTASDMTVTRRGTSGTGSFLGSSIAYLVESDMLNTNTPSVSDIKVSWSVSRESNSVITLDATNSVSAGFRALSQNAGECTAYGKLFVASDTGFTSILAESSVVSSSVSGNQAVNIGPVVYATVDAELVSSSTLYFGFATTYTIEVDGASFVAQSRFDDFKVNGISVKPPSGTVLIIR